MIRLLGSGEFNLRLLIEEAHAQWPDLIDVNTVEQGGQDLPAFYFPDGTSVTQADVISFLAVHDHTAPSSMEVKEAIYQAEVDKLLAAADTDTVTAKAMKILLRVD